jgi:hypothetical protein
MLEGCCYNEYIIPFKLSFKSLEQSAFRETDNHSTGHQISRVLQKSKIHYRLTPPPPPHTHNDAFPVLVI